MLEAEGVVAMTTVVTKAAQRPGRPLWRWLGVGMLAVPLLIIVVFAIGEGVGGESGWEGHLIQLAVVVALLVGGWFAPKVAGPLLIVTGLLLAVPTLIQAPSVGVISTALLIVQLPMILAGVFFTMAGYSRLPATADDDASDS
jgi:hypothetical protein